MNPRRVLLLWRERWGKLSDQPYRLPYIDGKVSLWGKELAASPVWSVPLLTLLVAMLCAVLFALVCTLPLSSNRQYAFSILVLGVALYLRRHKGTFVTLMMVALAFVASTRYLLWRLEATLVQDFSWDFILGFGLWAAEFHFCLLTAAGFATRIWPIQQSSLALPEDRSEWPSVDILIPCQDQDHAAILAATQAALALDWPRDKIKIYLSDGDARPDIAELAKSLGVSYLNRQWLADCIGDDLNHVWVKTGGQLIAVLDVAQLPAPDFLHVTAGWFMRESKLGMLHSTQHFLTPLPNASCLTLFKTPALGGSFAIFRRSALEDAQGIQRDSVTPQAHTALKLHAAGYDHACIGFRPVLAHGPETASTAAAFRVDTPFSDRPLRWKLRLSQLQEGLQFYYPLAQAVFYTAPGAYLLGAAYLVPVSYEPFLAYAAPHLLHGLIAKARVSNANQITATAYLRETLLAWYLFVLTALTLIRTSLRPKKHEIGAGQTPKKASVAWPAFLSFAAALVYVVAGLVAGGARLQNAGPLEQEALGFYFLWNGYLLLMLAAVFAVAQESRQIQLHQQLLLRLHVIAKLSSGRTIRCESENFPSLHLVLRLPPMVWSAGEELTHISLLLGRREFVFPVQDALHEGGLLRVHIPAAWVKKYQAVAQLAHARSKDWPEFLPGQNADHPLPSWLTTRIVALHAKALEFLANTIHHWSRKK